MTTAPVIIETLARVAPLGVRFWDAITRSTIGEGLSVTAHRANRPERRYGLILNRTDTFVLQNIQPEAEFGAGDQEYWNSLLLHPQPLWIIEVTDQFNRFLPFSFDVAAPHHKLFQWMFSSPLDTGQLVPLFSSPTRSISGGYGLLRADLRDETQFDARTGQYAPAPWAIIEAWYRGARIGRGLADGQGHLLVFVPYPEPIRPANASPLSQRRALTDQRWPVELQAFYSPLASPLTPTRAIPDLHQVLAQPSATLLGSLSPRTPLTQVDLDYGIEAILSTDDRSELLMTP